jgi:twitching motility protein PilT
MYFLHLVQEAIDRSASDLHLSSSDFVAFRMADGDLYFDRDLKVPVADDLQALLSLLPEQAATAFQRHHRFDAGVDVEGGQRIRLRLSKHNGGWSASCRLLPKDVRTLEDINAPGAIENVLEYQSGLVVVAGPTGEGKSTTLAAMIAKMNQEQRRRIVTVEDPIEYLHKSASCLVTQKEVPRDVASFEDAMLDALREDADVVMLGELRDARALRVAVTAADTGLLVLASAHARNAPSTVQRFVDAFPVGEKDLARSMIADSLRLFVAQALVKRADGRGRMAVFETLVNTSAVRNLIRTGELAQLESTIQTGSAQGMMTLKQSMARLVSSGVVRETNGNIVLRGRNSDR